MNGPGAVRNLEELPEEYLEEVDEIKDSYDPVDGRDAIMKAGPYRLLDKVSEGDAFCYDNDLIVEEEAYSEAKGSRGEKFSGIWPAGWFKKLGYNRVMDNADSGEEISFYSERQRKLINYGGIAKGSSGIMAIGGYLGLVNGKNVLAAAGGLGTVLTYFGTKYLDGMAKAYRDIRIMENVNEFCKSKDKIDLLNSIVDSIGEDKNPEGRKFGRYTGLGELMETRGDFDTYVLDEDDFGEVKGILGSASS